MKRIKPDNRITWLITIFLTICIWSCRKNVSNNYSRDGVNSAQGQDKTNRTGSLSPVPLNVTLSDAEGNRVLSDNGTMYRNGQQYVSATIDQYGNFIFATNPPAKAHLSGPLRWMNFDFSSPSQVFLTPPATGPYRCTYIATIKSTSNTNFIPLQNLGVNGNPASECITMGGGGTAGSLIWRYSYHRGIEDVTNTPTSYITVTRTSVNPDIWTLTPGGICSPNNNKTALRNDKDPNILYGYYDVPFVMTLARQ